MSCWLKVDYIIECYVMQNAERSKEGPATLYMDGTGTVCAEYNGMAVMAFLITMECLGILEGASRKGAAPLPLAVSLLTKRDESSLTDTLSELYKRLEQRHGPGGELSLPLEAFFKDAGCCIANWLRNPCFASANNLWRAPTACLMSTCLTCLS